MSMRHKHGLLRWRDDISSKCSSREEPNSNFKILERRRPQRRTSWRPGVGGKGAGGGGMEGGARGRWRGGGEFTVLPGPLLRAGY